MRRFAAGVFYLVVIAATAAAQAPASWPKVWNLGHPNATALIGIDVRGIRESAVGQSIGDQLKKACRAARRGAYHRTGRDTAPGQGVSR